MGANAPPNQHHLQSFQSALRANIFERWGKESFHSCGIDLKPINKNEKKKRERNYYKLKAKRVYISTQRRTINNYFKIPFQFQFQRNFFAHLLQTHFLRTNKIFAHISSQFLCLTKRTWCVSSQSTSHLYYYWPMSDCRFWWFIDLCTTQANCYNLMAETQRTLGRRTWAATDCHSKR